MHTPTPPPALQRDRERAPDGALADAQLAELLAGLEGARGEGWVDRARELPSRARVGLALALTAAGPAALLLGSGLKPELDGAGASVDGVVAVVVLSLSAFAATRALRSLSRPPPTAPWGPVIALVAVAVALVPASPHVLLGAHVAPGEVTAHAVCATVGAVLAGASLVVTWALRRSADAHRGANAGALAGGAALAALLLHCPYIDSAHQALGHVLVCVLAVGGTAWVASRR